MFVRGDMCQFGMATWIDKKGGEEGAVLKPTGFMTSSWAVADELGKMWPTLKS